MYRVMVFVNRVRHSNASPRFHRPRSGLFRRRGLPMLLDGTRQRAAANIRPAQSIMPVSPCVLMIHPPIVLCCKAQRGCLCYSSRVARTKQQKKPTWRNPCDRTSPRRLTQYRACQQLPACALFSRPNIIEFRKNRLMASPELDRAP